LTFPQAEFAERLHCINCGSKQIAEVSRGKFTDQPLRGFIESDPWGESPLPYLQEAEWVLVRCRSCEQIFHGRILAPDWNQRRFASWMSADAIREFEAREAARSIGMAARKLGTGRAHAAHALRIEKLTRAIRQPHEPVRLLDFGCGWGEFVLMGKLLGFDSRGVDRSAPRASGAAVAVHPSLDDLPPDIRFHAITAFEVFEHLDDPAAVLEQLARRLEPGGIFVVETPDCRGVSGIRSLDDYRAVHPLEHINAFTHRTLTSFFERRGFTTMSRGVAHVTADRLRVLKDEVKAALRSDGRSTQLYFRRMQPS
jgi:2-polyprenyl-3-methyl-5-hydroxy-6-metoxy-1,4-benzoquinol methylase